MRSRSFSLQARFLIGLTAFAILAGVFIFTILTLHLKSLMESEVSDKSHLILSMADAVQDYVRRELRPEMYKTLPSEKFIIEAMSSSYISRHVMDRLNVDASQYYYRRVALNARNPKSIPTELERNLILYFRSNTEKTHWEGQERVDGEYYYMSARPVVYAASCMRCHGQPQDAPQEMRDMYGEQRGFGYPVGKVSGVVCAGFPVQQTYEQIKDVTFGYIVLYLTGMVMFFILVSFYFNKLVVHNLHRLTSIFHRHFAGDVENRIIEKLRHRDEIEGLIDGMGDLAAYVGQTRQKLKAYTGNLETMVADRTLALAAESAGHQADVTLFVNLLRRLNESATNAELIRHAIGQIADRFAAVRVDYYCTQASNEVVSWPADTAPDPLPDNWPALLKPGRVRFDTDRALVPVRSQDHVWGLLCIVWASDLSPTDDMADVLDAIGQQLGIALENVHAISNLLHRKDMLQSVFEGISDPLMLLDSRGGVMMANRGAAELIEQPERQQRRLTAMMRRQFGLDRGDAEANLIARSLHQRRPWAQNVDFPDRRSYWISIYPIRVYQGQDDCVVMYARDVTTERQMLARMQRTEKLSAIGKLAAGLAHEINNPLGIIQCYTDLLKTTVTDDQARQDLEIIGRHTKQAQTVVQDLLNFARPKQGVRDTCDLNAVVENVVHVFKAKAATKSIQLETRLFRPLPMVKGSIATLEQILTNIWLNAYDALPPETGAIRISTSADEAAGEVQLKIADNGPGVPADIMDAIFDPFFTTKEVGQGTGLGLAVAYGLAEELDGRIEVENRGGAVFTVYLPLAEGKRKGEPA
jgi:two-component system, NtrC family, sensor kinase